MLLLNVNPLNVPELWGETVEEPMEPVTLVPEMPVNTRATPFVPMLLVTTTEKLVLPPVMMALVPPPKELVTMAILASTCR